MVQFDQIISIIIGCIRRDEKTFIILTICMLFLIKN